MKGSEKFYSISFLFITRFVMEASIQEGIKNISVCPTQTQKKKTINRTIELKTKS